MSAAETPDEPAAEAPTSSAEEVRVAADAEATAGIRAAGEPLAAPDSGEAQPRLRSRVLVPVLILVGFLGLAATLFRGWELSPTTVTLAGGRGEMPFYAWVLRSVPFAVGHGENPFITRHLNAPDGVNLMWNTSLFLPGLLLAPVTLLGGVVLTYNVLLTVAVGGSAWTAYLAIRRFVSSNLAAAVGGLVYGFSPYMRAQSSGHVNLTLALLPPLLLLLVHDILVRQRRRAWVDGALLGVLAAGQLLISEELLATTTLTAAVLLLVLLIAYPRSVRSRIPHALRAFGVAAAVFAALAAVPLWYQFFGEYRYYGPASGVAGRYVNDLYAFIVPSHQQVLSSRWSADLAATLPGNTAERDGYLGVPLILLAVGAAVRWWSRPVVRVAALVAVGTAVLSMGGHLYVGGDRTGVPLPWAAVHRVPLMESVIPSRLALYTALFVGLLVAVFLDGLRRWRWRWRPLGAALAVVALVPLVPHLVTGMGPVRVPAFFDGDGVERIPPGSVALVAPFPDRFATDPMLWHAIGGLRFKMVGGYFLGPDQQGRAHYGPTQSTTRWALQRLAAGTATAGSLERKACPAIREELEAWHVRTVLVGPNRHSDDMVEFFTLLLGRPPQEVGGMWIWENVDVGRSCR